MLCIITQSLYVIRNCTGSQCSWIKYGVTCHLVVSVFISLLLSLLLLSFLSRNVLTKLLQSQRCCRLVHNSSCGGRGGNNNNNVKNYVYKGGELQQDVILTSLRAMFCILSMISAFSSEAYKLGTSPVLSIMLMSSMKVSSLIWLSENRNTVWRLSPPAFSSS